jgi:hypothetical protein
MSLESLVEQYERQLITWQNASISSTKIVLDVLITRDIVHSYLQDDRTEVSFDLLVKIAELDDILQQQERSLAIEEIDIEKLKSYISGNTR